MSYASPARRAARKALRLAVEALDGRCLPSTTAVFDAPWRGYDTGAFPQPFGPGAVALGDLDGDGDRDAVVSNDFYGGPGLSVLKNQGGGTFAPPVAYPWASQAQVNDVALADVDADGDLDALATRTNSFGADGGLLLYRNAGDGTFAAPQQFATASGPAALAVADFTGDGRPDAVTVNADSGTVSLLVHNGQSGAAAGFLAPANVTVGTMPQGVAAADVTGDGRPDLAVAVGANTLVLRNTGSGFAAPVAYATAPGQTYAGTHPALADLDNDGDADLITTGYVDASYGYGTVNVRRNTGAGTFGSIEVASLTTFTFPVQGAVATGDLNGDGYVDVAVTSPDGRAGDGVSVLLNDRSGGFGAAAFFHAAQNTADVALADADGDGDRDILTVAHSSAALTVHLNSGAGVFPTSPKLAAGGTAWGIDAGDIDADGDVDLVNTATGLPGATERAYRVHRNNGDGTFAAPVVYALPIGPRQVLLRDLDGDGDRDLLIGPNANEPPYHLATALNNGDGTFAPAVRHTVNAAQEGTIDAADIDNDGDLDVVLTEEGTSPGGGQPRIFLFRNDGPQAFTAMPAIRAAALPMGLKVADLNRDGNLDLVTRFGNDGEGVGVYLGNGDFTFQGTGDPNNVFMPLRSGSSFFIFTLADMNADGKLDIVEVMPEPSFGTAHVGVGLGHGDGTFAPSTEYAGSSVLENLRIVFDIDTADVDRDGDADVVLTNDASNDLSVFLNSGNGTLGVHQRYGVGGYGPTVSVIADLTGDGAPDVASLVGQPPGGFPAAVAIVRGTASTPPPADQLQFGTSGERVAEAGGTVTLTVTRTGTGTGTVSVNYATADAAATAGQDYVAASGTLTWSAGDLAPKTVTVTVLNDRLVDPEEGFRVELSAPAGGAALGTPRSAVVTITDDERPGQLSLATDHVTISEADGSVTLTAVRTGGSDGAVSVTYETLSGTAYAVGSPFGNDYVYATGTLSWADGDTAPKTFTLQLVNDSVAEPEEYFWARLQSPTGYATVGQQDMTQVTVTDDDGGQQPPARVTSVAVNGGTGAQRSRVTSLTVTFDRVVTFADPANVAAAFDLARIGGGAVGGVTATAAVTDGRTVVTLTGFTGAETQFGSLADGRYRLTVRANQVANLDGNGDGSTGDDYTLTGSVANGLYRLFGDANGDGTVNAFDYGQFRPAFGSSSGQSAYVAWLDVDGDGAINAFDFGQFRNRFGAGVP